MRKPTFYTAFMLLCFLIPFQSINAVEKCKPDNIEFGISFPPVKNGEELYFTYTTLKDLNTNRVRISENWKYREPTQDSFNWSPLDARIKNLDNQGIQFILTIQSDAPEWIKHTSSSYNERSVAFTDSNNAQFEIYLERLLKRYKGKIKEIQFGNEWQSRWWYSGSKEEFTRTQNLFYDTVKKHDPNIRVVLGGFSIDSLRAIAAITGHSDQYITSEGKVISREDALKATDKDQARVYLERIYYILEKSRFDAVDLHFYDDPANWQSYLNSIKSLLPNAPVISTEFGGPNEKWVHYSDQLHDAELKKYMSTLNQLDIEYALYFKLVDESDANHAKSGLFDVSLRKKPGYYSFKEICNGLKIQRLEN